MGGTWYRPKRIRFVRSVGPTLSDQTFAHSMIIALPNAQRRDAACHAQLIGQNGMHPGAHHAHSLPALPKRN